MRGGITPTEQNVQNINPISQAVYDLIQHFNDPKKQHDLCGLFKADDGLDEINMKLRQTESGIKEVMSQLNTLRIAVGHVRAVTLTRGSTNYVDMIARLVAERELAHVATGEAQAANTSSIIASARFSASASARPSDRKSVTASIQMPAR